MLQKLKDAFTIAKIIFKGLFKLFKDLGLDTDEKSVPYTASKDIDDIADGIMGSGVLERYID